MCAKALVRKNPNVCNSSGEENKNNKSTDPQIQLASVLHKKEKIEFQYHSVLLKLDLQKSVSQFDSLVKAHIVERIGLM